MNMKDIIKKPNNHYITAFWSTLVVSISLIVGGFFCPPMGEVDGSILTAVGELFLWPALALGGKAIIDGRKATFQHGENIITIESKESDDEDSRA